MGYAVSIPSSPLQYCSVFPYSCCGRATPAKPAPIDGGVIADSGADAGAAPAPVAAAAAAGGDKQKKDKKSAPAARLALTASADDDTFAALLPRLLHAAVCEKVPLHVTAAATTLKG